MKKRIFSFALALCLCLALLPMAAFADSGVVIDETNFPDENFREYVGRFDINSDGVLSDAECAAVEEIDVDWMEISSLKGIEYFSGLRSLHCHFNGLTELDVSKNTALTELRCDGNSLAALDVSKNTALTMLSCDGNSLTALDVSKNTALTRLFCQANNLTALDVSKNTALTWLDCDDNALTSLDVSKNTALTWLICFGNDLATLDVSKNTALTELYCDDNALTSLDVSKNTALTVLSCGGNNLTALDVSKNTALTGLYCFGNDLATLDVSKNTALTSLNCDHNALTSLDVSKNTALTWLYCRNNNLTALDVSKNTALTSLFCPYNALTALDASKNTALTELHCFGNDLATLDVSKNTALTVLDCDDNALTSLDVSKNTALTELSCQNNNLTALDVSKNTALTKLRCSLNSLYTLDLSKNTKLEKDKCLGQIEQYLYIEKPLNGFDLGALIGSSNLSRITSVEGGSIKNGIVSCDGNEFTYYYDTRSALGSMKVTLICWVYTDPQAKFTDAVPESHWAHESIDFVLSRGIMSGTSETTFDPNGTVTRAMIAVMLYNLSGEPAYSGTNPFSDVPNDAWYASSVVWAYTEGIVSGNDDGTFNPNGKITREQLAIMMQNYAEYCGKSTAASYDLGKFADASSISPWAQDSVKWACANGIISGSEDGGNLYMNPKGNATRAQIAVIFQNFCETFDI